MKKSRITMLRELNTWDNRIGSDATNQETMEALAKELLDLRRLVRDVIPRILNWDDRNMAMREFSELGHCDCRMIVGTWTEPDAPRQWTYSDRNFFLKSRESDHHDIWVSAYTREQKQESV
jgi:hypothetical protein